MSRAATFWKASPHLSASFGNLAVSKLGGIVLLGWVGGA